MHKAIHICNSHQPMLKPKIAKEHDFINETDGRKRTPNAQHIEN